MNALGNRACRSRASSWACRSSMPGRNGVAEAPSATGPARQGDVLLGEVEEATAGHAEAEGRAVDQLVLGLRRDRDVAARAGVALDEGHGVGAVLLDDAAVLFAEVLRD